MYISDNTQFESASYKDVIYPKVFSRDKSKTLVFFPAFCALSDMYIYFLKDLENYFNVISLDYANLGFAVNKNVNLSIDLLTEVSKHFIEEQSSDDFILVGHSLGGIIALNLASSSIQERVKSLFIINSPLGKDSLKIGYFEKFLLSISSMDTLLTSLQQKAYFRRFALDFCKYTNKDLATVVTEHRDSLLRLAENIDIKTLINIGKTIAVNTPEANPPTTIPTYYFYGTKDKVLNTNNIYSKSKKLGIEVYDYPSKSHNDIMVDNTFQKDISDKIKNLALR